jgi:hypothetical protein
MIGQRRRLGLGRLAQCLGLVALAGLVLTAVPPSPAGANHTTYEVPETKLGYSACAWPAARVLSVAVDEAYPFPDQTYVDRLDEAIAAWNQVLATSNRGGGMVRTSAPADILVQYRPVEPLHYGTPDDPDQAIAEVYLQRAGEAEASRDIAKCPDRRPSTLTLTAAYVRISPRDDWFTGDESSTGVWQMCSDPNFQPPSASVCEDSVDFGTTMVHEMGHALAIYHPQTLDAIDQVSPEQADSATSWAACAEVTKNFDTQSSMCDGQTLYDSDGRTLETWDVESVHRLYS